MFTARLSTALTAASAFYIGDRLGGWFGPAQWSPADDGNIRVGFKSPHDGAEFGVALLSNGDVDINEEGLTQGVREVGGGREVVLRLTMVRPLRSEDIR